MLEVHKSGFYALGMVFMMSAGPYTCEPFGPVDHSRSSGTGGGGSTGSGGATTSTSSATPPCTAKKDCDDGKDCSVDSCAANGTCAHDLSACPCRADDDCEDTECIDYSCVNNGCVPTPIHVGEPVTEQKAGDCATATCGPTGEIVNTFDPDDPEDDENECRQDTCSAVNNTAHPPVMAGTECNGGKGLCNFGQCETCDDGTRNGNETDIDCGGPQCDPCMQGQECLGNGDCANAYCEPASPDNAMKICCDGTCSGPCKACSGWGPPGTCISLPAGAQSGMCSGNNACAGDLAGTCNTDLNGKKPLGGPCNGDGGGDCYGVGSCVFKICQLPNTQPCSPETEWLCESNRCTDAHQCAACNLPADCESNQCVLGVCLLNTGVPCASNDECVSGNCSNNPSICQ